MTKDELLVLLGSLDSIEAGVAASYVESLDKGDPRFQGSFLGKPLSTLGYWLEQKKIASGGGFSSSNYLCKPVCIELSIMVSLLKEAMISTLTHLQGQEAAVEALLVRLSAVLVKASSLCNLLR